MTGRVRNHLKNIEYPVELQDRARLHFPYTTYYHVESVLQKRLKRQDHPLLIVSISIYNSGDEDGEKNLLLPPCLTDKWDMIPRSFSIDRDIIVRLDQQ